MTCTNEKQGICAIQYSKLKYFLVPCKELIAYACTGIERNLTSNLHGVRVTTKVCTDTVARHQSLTGIEHARNSQSRGGIGLDTSCSK